MKTILVTGARGFVGRNLIPKLKNSIDDAVILTPTHEELDLSVDSQVVSYFKSRKIDEVIHLAARMAGIGELTNKPRYYLEKNLLINYNIVHSSIEFGVKKFLTLGTSCAYNNYSPIPMKEDSLWDLKPENTYGICKMVLLEHLMSQDTMGWVYLIPGNLYGPHDHFGKKNAHLIPATFNKFVECELYKKDVIEVWGDGSQIRDFMYVDDAINIILKAYFDERYAEKPINISACEGTSVKEIVLEIRSCFKELLNREISIDYDTTKPTGIKEKVLSNKLFLEIEKKYEFTTIREGLRKTFEWYCSNADMKSISKNVSSLKTKKKDTEFP